MHTTSSKFQLNATTAEKRRGVHIPEPIGKPSKGLKSEFAALQARADALEADRQNAKRHRQDFLNELAELTEPTPQKGKKTTEEVPTDAGTDQSLASEAREIRELGVSLLRKELRLRSDMRAYLERWQTEGHQARQEAERRLEETQAAVQAWLIEGPKDLGGFHDPVKLPFSPSRVLPGDLLRHPAVVEAREAFTAAETELGAGHSSRNRDAISELRGLIGAELGRLAGVGAVG